MASLNLPPEPGSPQKARAFARHTLSGRGVAPETITDAELLVTEVVTNAVVHARTPLVLEVDTERDGAVRFSVRDHSSAMPQMRQPSPRAGAGRGLRIVDGIASRWWVERRTDGKVVNVVLPPRRPAAVDPAGDRVSHSSVPAQPG